MSGAPIIRGISQLPKPPITSGIVIKKIIIKAWEVTTTLYKCSFDIKDPTFISSERIIILKEVPINPLQTPKIKYKTPISLWLVEKAQTFIFY